MPDIYIKVNIDFMDYFSVHGFNDGQLEWLGYQYMEDVTKILNDNLDPTPVSVKYMNATTSNNECQLDFIMDDTGSEIDIDEENIFETKAWAEALSQYTFDELPPDKKMNCLDAGDSIVRALKKSKMEVDDFLMDDITRILQTPDNDLPLLVGKLMTSDGKNLLARIFKRKTFKCLSKNKK